MGNGKRILKKKLSDRENCDKVDRNYPKTRKWKSGIKILENRKTRYKKKQENFESF